MTATIEARKLYPRGTFSAIARELGVTPQSVRDVARGTSTSARIAEALRRVAARERRRQRRREAATAVV